MCANLMDRIPLTKALHRSIASKIPAVLCAVSGLVAVQVTGNVEGRLSVGVRTNDLLLEG